jgi:hypothetical protein
MRGNMPHATLTRRRLSDSGGPKADDMLDPSRVSYQWTLRQIGVFLNEQGGCRMSLVEVPDGFQLRYYVGHLSRECRVHHFLRQELISRHVKKQRTLQRPQKTNASSDHRSPDSRSPGGYQDSLRALGYELDRVSVFFIVLDEVGEALIVTYLSVDARYNLNPRKKMVFLQAQDRQAIVSSAHERRRSDANVRRKTEFVPHIFS